MNPIARSQYSLICSALNSTNHDRLIYDTKTKVFMVASRAFAKNHQDPNYHTDLSQLKEDIEEYIQANGIEEGEKTAIETAFKERKKRLKGRIVLRHRDRRSAAVEQLRTIKHTIKEVKIASMRSEGSTPPTKETPSLRRAQTLPITTSKQTVPPLQGKTSIPSEPPLPPPAGGPPPPPPPIGGPPPPPLMGSATSKTFAHRKLTTDADKHAKFQGEPTRPTISDDHDLGRAGQIPPADRQRYASEIEAFINGTPYLVNKSQGLGTSTQIQHQKNGLVHTIQRIEEAINSYKATLEELEGKQVQTRDLEKKIDAVQKRVEKMQTANQEGEVFTLYTKGPKKGTIGTPVTFYPDATYQTYRKKLEAISEEKRRGIRLFPETKTLSHQIKIQHTLLIKLQKEQQELQEEIGGLEEIVERTKKREDNGIPFLKWEPLLNEKKKIRDSWLSAKGNLESGATQQKERSLSVENPEILSLLEDGELSLSLEESSFLETLPQAQQGSYLRHPEIFFEELISEEGI